MDALSEWLNKKGWFILETADFGDDKGSYCLVAMSPSGMKWRFTGDPMRVVRSDMDFDATISGSIETMKGGV